MTPAELERICVAAAQAGAQVLRELLEKPREIALKGRIDLVTDADRAAEERILALLRQRVPGAAVLAEESGESGRGELRFIVDPLDGTTNYAHGLPLFSCTVAAEVSGEPVAGCTVDPMRAETFPTDAPMMRQRQASSRTADRPWSMQATAASRISSSPGPTLPLIRARMLPRRCASITSERLAGWPRSRSCSAMPIIVSSAVLPKSPRRSYTFS